MGVRIGRSLACLLLLAAMSVLTACDSDKPAASSDPAAASGVRGTVVAVDGLHGGPRPRPGGSVVAHSGGPEGRVVGTGTVDADGAFEIDLPAGTYTLVQTGSFGKSPEFATVTVEPGRYSDATLALQMR